jgi:hypothetical protein
MTGSWWPSPVQLADIAPLAERALSVDEDALVRLRSGDAGGTATLGAYVRLPYDVLAGRTISVADGTADWPKPFDLTATAQQLLAWIAGADAVPQPRDAHWLSPLPPRGGWRRIEVVPDTAVRDLVRSGALLARSTSSRGEQQSLLASIVLHATSESGDTAEVPLGPISALTRMGFLPRGGSAAVDTAPGWLRIAAAYGSTFVATDAGPLGGLGLLGLG